MKRKAEDMLPGLYSTNSAYNKVTVIRTQKDSTDRLAKVGSAPLGADGSIGAQDKTVFVCLGTDDVKRPFVGIGGSWTEASAVTLQKLSKEKQEVALTAYFDKEKGLGFNFGRLHMGSCDFSVSHWNCGDIEEEEDMELKKFNIDKYHEAIFPLMKRAYELAGAPMPLLVSPWSPPKWMKTTGLWHGNGRLRKDCGQVWALHFAKFVKAISAAGIPTWAVSVQNEPEAAQRWESCIYSAEEERDFVRDHLGPTLAKEGLEDVKIIIWDHNRDGMLERAAVAYGDPEAAKYIWGVGYHWYGDARFESWPQRIEVPYKDRQKGHADIFELKARLGFDNVRAVADLRPDKHIIFTEGCQECGRDRKLEEVIGNWMTGERYAFNMIKDFASGCEGWIDWNLYLDEQGGPNHKDNFCSAPIICDTKKDEIIYEASYWYMGHFSKFIQPGAFKLLTASSRDVLQVVGFANPDQTIVVIVLNQSEIEMNFWLKVGGSTAPTIAVELYSKPRSITTLILEESKDPADIEAAAKARGTDVSTEVGAVCSDTTTTEAKPAEA
mmetsp:Transcript_122446/g.236047  ORF Transcript_122446/g.236047 Transcript_122446/m.236047 type:complete len:552 (-) Transcript_122446:50-1705(-)